MSTPMAPLPSDDPRIVAWNAYKATPEFANSKNWCKHEEHVDGSMWAVFISGFDAATAQHEARVKELEAERQRDALDGQAALDEANNLVMEQRTCIAELESEIDRIGIRFTERDASLQKTLAERDAAIRELSEYSRDCGLLAAEVRRLSSGMPMFILDGRPAAVRELLERMKP